MKGIQKNLVKKIYRGYNVTIKKELRVLNKSFTS